MQGRWARLIYFKEKLLIAWINGISVNGKIVKYIPNLYFPINTNDMPFGVEKFDTYQEALEYVVTEWTKLKYLIIN